MAKKNKNDPVVRLLILVAAVAVPLLFILATVGTQLISTSAPYVLLIVLAVLMAVYSGSTASLLYQYYEVSPPWYRFIPCYGELTLMDGKYLKIGTVFYILALLFFGASRVPYSVMKIFGEDLSFSMPFYFTVLSMMCMLVVSVIKGLGMVNCEKVIADEWNDKINASLGFIKSFAWFGFVPFVRVLAIYGLNKPLSTLVTFNSITVSDNNNVVLEEEDDGAMV